MPTSLTASLGLLMANPDTTNTTTNGGDGEGSGSDYLAFALVLAFFVVGLSGVVVCHVLKKRGYRLTTSQEDDEYDDVFDEAVEAEQQEPYETMNENQDTVGHIIQCIMKNEANSDALNAMVHQTSIDSDIASSPPLTPVLPVSPPGEGKPSFNHQHTVSSLNADENKWPLTKRPSLRKSVRRRPSEVTVLSVGRFRVTKSDKSGKDRTSECSYQSVAADAFRNSKVMTSSLKEISEYSEE
ncbi:RELT-like protein 1 [Poecilia reticulata]|uniref:RELT like 1 n=1 Tax=Poecilia reticulata TaxID=8081 RepID=A0A3P9P5P8_POERE|nr:PREDICTED: RELT-like protein 1 [Poecilia reticulata]